MKKTALNLTAGLVVFLCINTTKACDYMVWISNANQGTPTMDTLCLKEGESLPIYALHTSGFINYFSDPVRQLFWIRDGVTFDTTNHTNAIHDGILYFVTTLLVSQPGVYQVKYITPNNQEMIMGQVVIINCPVETTPMHAGLPQEGAVPNMNIYPNPSSEGFINIDAANTVGISNVEIINSEGMTVSQITPNNAGIITIATSEMQKGLYFVRVNYRGETITKKVILN